MHFQGEMVNLFLLSKRVAQKRKCNNINHSLILKTMFYKYKNNEVFINKHKHNYNSFLFTIIRTFPFM